MGDFGWLHFSDLHLSGCTLDAEMAKDKLIKFVEKKREENQLNFQYIFITGDIANRGEYEGTKDFMKKLFSACGLNCTKKGLERVYWAVGNHDIDRSEIISKGRRELIAKIRDPKDPLTLTFCLDQRKKMEGRALLRGGMELFTDNHKELLAREYSKGQNPHQIYKLPDLNLIVLNTCLTSVDENDTHNLHIKSNCLKEVFEQIADRSKPIFVLGHHGRDFFCMEDMDVLSDIFDSYGADVYLCGHNHRTGFAVFPDAERDIYQLTCGGGAEFRDGSCFSFMHGFYDDTRKTIRITPYCYMEKGDKNWGESTQQNRRLKPQKAFPLSRLIDMKPAISSKGSNPGDVINILHLSDLQFGITEETSGKAKVAINERKAVLEEKLLLHLQNNIPKAWRPHIVVASGDLAWGATRSDYKEFSEWLEKLLGTLQIPMENVILCTGNHDINSVAAQKNSSRKEKVDKSLAYDELSVEDDKCTIYENFREFISFCRGEVNKEVVIHPLCNSLPDGSGGRYLYGYRDLLGIRFNVLNTSWYCGDNKKKEDSVPDKENLWIGEDFVQDLEQSLSQNDKFSVTVFHHPFGWLNPEEGSDSSDVKNWLLKMSDIILCGHIHEKIGEPTFEHNHSQIFRSGALWTKDKRYVYESRIIQINKTTGQVSQLTLEYDDHGKTWNHKVHKRPNRDESYPINYTKHPKESFGYKLARR